MLFWYPCSSYLDWSVENVFTDPRFFLYFLFVHNVFEPLGSDPASKSVRSFD